MTEIPWKDLCAVLQQAHLIIADLLEQNTAVYACPRRRDDGLLLMTRHGDDIFCLLRQQDNETAQVVGTELVVTAWPDFSPDLRLTVYKRWEFTSDPAFSGATQ